MGAGRGAAVRAAADDHLAPRIRQLIKDDWAYILDSWKKSYRELGSEQHIPKHLYWPNQHAEIEFLKVNPDVEFRIAADPDDKDFIWGWACIESKAIVHYVFVRASAQGQGVAKLLLADIPRPVVATHWTKLAEAIHRDHPGSLLFEPSRRRR